MGHRIVFYERDVPYYAKHRDFTSVDFCRLVLYRDWTAIRASALADARGSDVVINASFCPEGAKIVEDVLALAGPLRVFYDLDTPVTLDKLEKSECEYLRRDQIVGFDLYLSWCGGKILQALQSQWLAKSARPLYGCVDPEVHSRIEVPESHPCRMSYMGTHSDDRAKKVKSLLLEPARKYPGDQFVLAGSQYPHDWDWPQNLCRFEHVSPHHHSALYSASKFTLNLTRDMMARDGYCPSGRLFEAAACGTPIISDWFEGLSHFFEPDEEILVAQETGDVLRHFDVSEGELKRVAKRARQRTLTENTGQQRARELVRYLEDAAAKRPVAIAEVA